VWNVVTGQPPEAGILDYDLAYFDDSDLSWDAEDAVIEAGRQAFDSLPAPVQIRNQARVHLWYEQKFGLPCQPHQSTEAAIDTFEATTACLGVRLQSGSRWRIYAPHGLADVFNLVVRPNPVLAPRHVYQAKTAHAVYPGRRFSAVLLAMDGGLVLFVPAAGAGCRIGPRHLFEAATEAVGQLAEI
jgi:hypothetical protein